MHEVSCPFYARANVRIKHLEPISPGTCVALASSYARSKLAQISNEKLALACNGCDPAALAELFRRFCAPVTQYLSHLTGSTDVDDLVQSIFMEIVRGKARFEGRSTAKAWLFGIARNVWRQHCIKAARRSRLQWTVETVALNHAPDSPATRLEARQNAKSLCSAFDSLSEKSRRAFFLCVVEGLSARQAGRLLDASEVAIWKRVSDTRKSLQRALEA